MSVRAGQGSDIDNEAAWIDRIVTRLGAVERSAHVHPPFGDPGGIPTEDEIIDLIEATGDLRYLLKSGDTATGLLTAAAGLRASAMVVGTAGIQNLVVIGDGTGTAKSGYIGYYPEATGYAALGTRFGYIGPVTGNMYLVVEDAAANLDIRTGSGAEMYLRRGATALMALRNSGYVEAIGPMLCSNGSAPLRVTRTGTPTRPYMDFYHTDLATRYAAIVGASTSLEITSDTGLIDLIPLTSGGSEVRAHSTGVYFGKTASNLATKGVELYGSHATAGGSVRSTTTTASIQNFYARHESAANATNQMFFQCATAGGTDAGKITQASASSCAYNTASDRKLKHDIHRITREDALRMMRSYIPVTYRERAEGDDGPVYRGYIAQQVYRLAPWATSGSPLEQQADGQVVPMGVDYGRTSVDAMAGGQAVDAEVTDLKVTVADLTAALEAALERIAALEAQAA